MKTMALIALTVATVFLTAGGAWRLSSAQAAQSVQAGQNCQNTQLVMLPYSGQGAAGHILNIYRLHNQSARACTLFGYPGALLLDRQFLSLPTTVHRGPGNMLGPISQQLVRLAPQGNAYFTLAYSDVPVGNKPCQKPAYYLMVTAPNDYLPDVTYASGHGGSIYSCTGDLNVSPVTSRPRLH